MKSFPDDLNPAYSDTGHFYFGVTIEFRIILIMLNREQVVISSSIFIYGNDYLL